MITFNDVVKYLESLSIMPKEMPGIDKIKNALNESVWFKSIDPSKVIVVAGTNGKGSTCAVLESLLTAANCKVGFYSSPHLVDTTERIRINKLQISKSDFVNLFLANKNLIEKHQLTHFEALTLMAADCFFNLNNVDYAIFEVGLGGTFDATNAIPHSTSVITALGLDHVNILGSTLPEIAANKFGIIQPNNCVVHHALPSELNALKEKIQHQTNSMWFEANPVRMTVSKSDLEPKYVLETKWGRAVSYLLGRRAAENAGTALTVFEKLGFDPSKYLSAIESVKWNGRMQKLVWPKLSCALYLSGDHNIQGVQSLIQILGDFSYKNLFLVVGIGKDKDSEQMLQQLFQLERSQIYLTETPFKGLTIAEYPTKFLQQAQYSSNDVFDVLNKVSQAADENDLVVVTGSLYLVGKVLANVAKP